MSTPNGEAAAASRVVFIDSNVADLQDLLAGLAPGEAAFVLDPGGDGLEQIADILAANKLTGLSSISIVGHGSSGAIDLGSTALDDGDLSSHATALAQIGGALGSGGELQLYACDVASGAAGQQFIADLSRFAGNADVAAATHLVGGADEGGSWTLDASAGPTPASVGAPFTAAALAAFQWVLVAPVDMLTATQTTTLTTDVDGDGVVDPGDTVTTSVTIVNTSDTDNAPNVSFNETLSGMSFVNGSVHVTPIAFDDTGYHAIGNVALTIGAGAGVLVNDIDPNASSPLSNVGVTATSVDNSLTHGTAALNSDGSFTFTPDTGFTGTTTFKYTAHDAEGLNSNVQGTVTVTVGPDVWFIDNSQGTNGDGSQAHPFNSIANSTWSTTVGPATPKPTTSSIWRTAPGPIAAPPGSPCSTANN
jgi:hypothetical protein